MNLNKTSEKFAKMSLTFKAGESEVEKHIKLHNFFLEKLIEARESRDKEILEKVENMEMEDTQNGKYGEHFKLQAELLNKHIMPHIKERFKEIINN